MPRADLSYLVPLFDIASSLLGDPRAELPAFGLGDVEVGSSLEKDDRPMQGYLVSHVVRQAIGAAVDHAITLRDVCASGAITNAAPWTLLRGVLEPAALAVWVMAPDKRSHRQERALRVWHTDMHERATWESKTGGRPPRSTARSGLDRAAAIRSIGEHAGLRPTQIATRLNYADVVGDSAAHIGRRREAGEALWRECSGFAHGRTWPLLTRSTPAAVNKTRDGFELALTFAEEHHREAAALTTALLESALDTFAQRAVAGSA